MKYGENSKISLSLVLLKIVTLTTSPLNELHTPLSIGPWEYVALSWFNRVGLASVHIFVTPLFILQFKHQLSLLVGK